MAQEQGEKVPPGVRAVQITPGSFQLSSVLSNLFLPWATLLPKFFWPRTSPKLVFMDRFWHANQHYLIDVLKGRTLRRLVFRITVFLGRKEEVG